MLRFCRRLGTELVAAGITVAILGAIAHADTAAPPAPAPAAPPPPPAAAEVQLDIVDAAGGGAAFSGVLAIAGGDCGSLETSAGPSTYHVVLCLKGRDAGPRILSVNVDRSATRGRDVTHQKMETSARVDPGKRIVLARFGVGPDTTEIAATVK